MERRPTPSSTPTENAGGSSSPSNKSVFGHPGDGDQTGDVLPKKNRADNNFDSSATPSSPSSKKPRLAEEASLRNATNTNTNNTALSSFALDNGAAKNATTESDDAATLFDDGDHLALGPVDKNGAVASDRGGRSSNNIAAVATSLVNKSHALQTLTNVISQDQSAQRHRVSKGKTKGKSKLSSRRIEPTTEEIQSRLVKQKEDDQKRAEFIAGLHERQEARRRAHDGDEEEEDDSSRIGGGGDVAAEGHVEVVSGEAEDDNDDDEQMKDTSAEEESSGAAVLVGEQAVGDAAGDVAGDAVVLDEEAAAAVEEQDEQIVWKDGLLIIHGSTKQVDLAPMMAKTYGSVNIRKTSDGSRGKPRKKYRERVHQGRGEKKPIRGRRQVTADELEAITAGFYWKTSIDW